MNPEKVYCSECKYCYMTLLGAGCRKTVESHEPENFYRPAKTGFVNLVPEEQNRNNNCLYYEARKT